MKYTVVWAPRAERDLAAVWMNSPARNDIAAATYYADKTLREDPDVRGESRSGSLRVLHVLPLGFEFEVVEPDRLVRIVRVWTVQGKR